MKFTIITIFLFLNNTISLLSQNYDKKLNLFIDSLHGINVKTIILFYECNIGDMFYVDSGSAYASSTDTSVALCKYLYWIQNQNKYLTRFSNWGDFQKLNVDTSRFLDLLLKNIDKVKLENIKPVAYGNENAAVFGTTISVIEIKTDTLSLKKVIDHFDLYTEYFDKTKLNLNYSYNQNTVLKRLKELAESELEIYDKSNVFKKN